MDYFVIKYPADGEYFPETVYCEYKAQNGRYYRRYVTQKPNGYDCTRWKRISEKSFISGWEEYKNV